MGAPKTPSRTSQVTTAELPEYVRPFFERLMQRAEVESLQPYQPFQGQQIADFSPLEKMAFSGYEDLYRAGERPELQFARDQASSAAQMGNYYSNVDTPQVDYAQSMAGMAGDVARTTPMWDSRSASQYMSPYQQAVTDIELNLAQEDFDRKANQRARSLAASSMGSGPSSRSAIDSINRARDLANQRSEIQARGSQKAWDQGQAQFDRDRAARFQASKLGMDSGQQMINAMNAEQAYRMRGSEFGMGAGREMAGIGDASQKQAMARLQGLIGPGALGRELNQQALDAVRRQYVAARDYPRQNLAFLAGALRGVPTASMDATVMNQGGSETGKAISAGLGTLGMMGALKGMTG